MPDSLSLPNPHAWRLSDLASVEKNGLKVMTTFSCGGGSTMGYKLAGFDVIAANDIDPEMQCHYIQNFQPDHYFLCPIGDLLKRDLPPELFNLDVLDGSPPCSTFSMAGHRERDWGRKKHFREGQTEQVLSDLFFDYLDLVRRLKPKVAIAENVKGMLIGNAKGYVKLIVKRFREIGYRVQVFLINSADCGVPQRRERAFFCAIRDDIQAPPLVLKPSSKWVSAAEACSDIQELTETELNETRINPGTGLYTWWPRTQKGQSFGDSRKAFGEKENWFSKIRLDDAAPSNTLTARCDGDMTHWDVCRRLTLREFIRLGSFPDDYQFKSRKIGSYLIGMSVPPKMMQFVATEIAKQWLSGASTLIESEVAA